MNQQANKLSPKLLGLRVLIVDDSQAMRKLVRSIVEGLGIHQIYDTDNCDAATKKMREEGFDIILVDWKMEPVNGLDFVKSIRGEENSVYSTIPIILITAHASKELVIAARDAGVNEILIKPVSAKVVHTHLEAIFEKPRPFIRNSSYIGPDRRRRADGYYEGPDRRKPENAAPDIKDPKDQ